MAGECQACPAGGGKQGTLVAVCTVEFRFTGALTAGCYGVEASLLSDTRRSDR